MSMLEEIWTCGLTYKDRPVKPGSPLERTLCLYAKNQDKLKAMLSEEQNEQYKKDHRRLQRRRQRDGGGSLRAWLHSGRQADDRRDAVRRDPVHRRRLTVRNWFAVIKEYESGALALGSANRCRT